MKTYCILCLGLLTLLCGQVSAATVSLSISSNSGPMFTTSLGDMLSMGSSVRIGGFDLSGGNLTTIQTSNDYYAVNALFSPVGESGGNSGQVNQFGNASTTMLMINDFFGQGNILGQIANIEAAHLAAGRQLFAWVFNSATPENATEWGIYSSSTGWRFPNSLGSDTLATFEVDTVLRGGTLLHATSSPDALATGSLSSNDRLTLSPVPEPGSLLLLILGSCFTLRRIRRSAF